MTQLWANNPISILQQEMPTFPNMISTLAGIRVLRQLLNFVWIWTQTTWAALFLLSSVKMLFFGESKTRIQKHKGSNIYGALYQLPLLELKPVTGDFWHTDRHFGDVLSQICPAVQLMLRAIISNTVCKHQIHSLELKLKTNFISS